MSTLNFNCISLENKLVLHKDSFPELTYAQYRVVVFYSWGGDFRVLAENDEVNMCSHKRTLHRAKGRLNCKNLDDLRSLVLIRLLFS